MKKLTLFLVATLFSALSFAALNPYAYGLSSELDGTTLTVNYSLNAPATAVSVVIMDGETEVKTIACDGITKGSHTVEVPTTDCPKKTALTWKVVVNGNSVGTPTLHDESIRFYLPYGMDIDVDPESDYLGHWYVIEATNGGQAKSGYQSNPFGRGLYAFDAALNPILNSAGTRGFLGGVNAGATETNVNSDYVNFYRVATSGGRVFIGRFRDGAAYHPIVEANPADLNANFTTVFETGRAVSIDAKGSGENLKLVMLAKDNNIYEYDLGNAKSIAAASRTINKGTLSIVRDDATITYDNNGDIWFNQHQGSPTATTPTIAHLSIEDGFDWNNASAGISHANTSNSGIAVSPDGKQLAVVGAGTKNITIYNIDNTDGNITLTKAYSFAVSEGNNHTALAWDYAGNLYAANRSNERIRIYAMPYSGTVSTPCASKYAFELEEVETYTITAHATNNTMGYVTGGGTYYAGETVTLKAVANSTYCFVNWSDGNTDATRTFTATADVTLTANFAKAFPRAWAYDLKMVEDGDNYKFSFNATTAANATLLFLDKEGNELYAAHEVGAVAAGANTVSIEKAYFTQVKDVYWSVKMDGEAINSVAEITDQSRNIYDFYNMQGVVVDNNPNSEKFGEIYIEMAKSGTTNGKAQTLGLFLLNQNLAVLNTDPNVGIQPTMPSGYALNGTNYTFQRLNIHPKTGDLVFSYGISSKPAVFAIDRENMTGSVTNLLDGITGLTKTVAHCFDAEGTLYVMDLPGSGTIYKIKDGAKSTFAAANSKYAASNITMASDGRGGLWVAQNRGQIDGYYQLAHINSNGDIDWAIYDDLGTYKASPATLGTSSKGFTGYSTRGALAYDAERQILAQGRNNAVEVFSVAYDATTGVPSLTKIATTPIATAANIDGIAFDYAGDLYVVNSGNEKFNKYTLPTAENICTVPAPESQAIIKEVRYTITVNTVGNGSATGAGEYVEGETATLKAIPAANHQFVNWTFDDKTTSADNPLELVVNSDIIVTANFKPIQYTLIAPTNDENKGTVTGAGTYSYGTEVTLTATPKAGYKLLYWSDRSTENPRTITMNKNEALSAYFVKEYVVEPTFTIEKVWENTNVPGSAAGYQAVGWDGKIYMQNKTEGKIKVYNNGTDAAVDYAASNTSGQQIAVDEAGNLIVFNAYFATATPSAIQIYKNGSTTGTAVSFTLPNPGRCDFISASGDIYSQDGGYVYFYCDTHKLVNRVKISNGAASVADVSVDAIGNTRFAAASVSHVMVDIFGNLAAHSRSNAVDAINIHTGETTAFNTSLSGIKLSTLGGCSFELGGKEFWAYNVGNTHYNSEWNLYNMTNKVFMSNETLYAKDKVSKKNTGPANWLNVQVVDENTAYIYQFCPEVAVAVWKVTMHEVVLRDTENNEDLLIDLNGSTTNVSVYRSLTGGMYNTLCLPFDVNDLAGTPLENATVWQYNGATGDGTNKEIFLDFKEVTSITAGEPYLVEPTEDIAAPMIFKAVTISAKEGSDVVQGIVTMHGILHPTELEANDKSILFLVENNNLAWANVTANMNGMRAYFKVNEPSLLSARTRAYIRRGPTVATDMEYITTSDNEIKKVIYNGNIYILRGDEVYTIHGTKVK